MLKILLAAVVFLSALFNPPAGKKAAKVDDQIIHYRNHALVLIYHELAEPEKSETISPDKFMREMDLLKIYHYNVITMQQFIEFITQGKPVPPNAVLITFDDGYESFYNVAFPILRKYGFTASDFVIVGSTDMLKPGALPHLTWDEMKVAKAYGMGFYSHTYDSHYSAPVDAAGTLKPVLTNRLYLADKGRIETEAEYQARIEADLQMADQRLFDELGKQPVLFCYPYGKINDVVRQALKKAGTQLYFTSDPGTNSPGKVDIKRVNVGIANVDPSRFLQILRQYDE